MEQVTLMNTCSPLTFRNQRSLKLSVDYYCITAPFFSAPCLPCQSTPPASSFERFFSLQLAHPPLAFTFSSSPLLLVTVWIKVFRVMTAVGRLQWLKDKDVIAATYYSRCLFWLRNKKINTIKSRPRLNELAAEGKTTEEERVSFFSRAWNNPTHLNTSFICALCFNKEDG